ncbi:MAG: aldose epimerase family protein [Phyllobacterium sp.]
MTSEIFGHTENGEAVHRLTIVGGGLTAKILTWGAVVQDLRLQDHDAPLVLGYRDFADYPKYSPCLGAIPGRSANRIRNGRITLDGKTYQLDCNFQGAHNLHGGTDGTHKKIWEVVALGRDYAALTLDLPDGHMGFPGRLSIRCTYMLQPGGVLAVRVDSVSDKTTICNLTHHSYFNLDDGGLTDILDHQLMIGADAYLPVDEALIPDGRTLPVQGSTHDFRQFRPIRLEHNGKQVIYDNNYCLSAARVPMRWCATAKGAQSGVQLDVLTTEPGLQFYAGNTVARPAAGLTGQPYEAYAGFCLEAQVWPDSPNHPYFPQAVLHAGEGYTQETQYRFSKN